MKPRLCILKLRPVSSVGNRQPYLQGSPAGGDRAMNDSLAPNLPKKRKTDRQSWLTDIAVRAIYQPIIAHYRQATAGRRYITFNVDVKSYSVDDNDDGDKQSSKLFIKSRCL